MISSVYDYYLSTYGNKEVSKYDSHRKSELKDVYYSMLRVNRKSPLYKFENLSGVQKYAIDIKEAAREFKNVAASLTNQDGSIAAFSRKKAESGNEKLISALYLGDEEGSDGFDISVKSMAKAQVNVGKFSAQEENFIQPGSYSFDLAIGKYTYEFSFDVSEGKKNREVQSQIANLINRSDIGVKAELRENAKGETALEISSEAIGIVDSSGLGKTFVIQNNDKSESGDIVEMMGLDNTKTLPQNAVFSIDGEEHTASSNEFISNDFRIRINAESPDEEVVKVRLKPDFDAMMDNVSELVDSYNSMIDMAASHIDDGQDSDRLLNEIKRVVKYYKEGLDSAGFTVADDGHINIEESLLIQSVEEGTVDEGLEQLNLLKKALVKKAGDMSVDPMKYVNKKMIAYPNPVRSFTNPYVTSIYSGMMFNGYI